MILYLIGIVGGGISICILNLILFNGTLNYTTFNICIGSLLAVMFEIAIDGIIAAIVRKCLPERFFTYQVNIHNPSKKECKFYEKLGIKRWKDHVLELGMYFNFNKREIADAHDIKYIETFIMENNFGAVNHFISCFAGALIIPFFPINLANTIAMPAIVINFILNLLPFMILRYNTDRLQRVRKVLVGKALRQQQTK